MKTALTANSTINELRQAIYRAAGVGHLSGSRRTRKLRKVLPLARGLDLRRKANVVFLAQHLGLIETNVIYVEFGESAAA